MIEPFPWSDAFAVGDVDLDDEHRRIVGLINEICVNVLAQKRERKLLLLRELQAVSEAHFRNEEAVLAQVASEINQHHLRTVVQTAIELHSRSHHRELNKLDELTEKLRASKARSESIKLCDELKTWFIDHTVGQETQVKTILQSTRHLGEVH